MRPLAWLVLAALLAGCAAPQAPAPRDDQPPASPQELVLLAMERLARDLGPEGELQRLHADITSEGEHGSFDQEFGADGSDVVRVDLPPLNITMWCQHGQGAVRLQERLLLAGGACTDERAQVRENLTGLERSVLSVRPEGPGYLALVRETNETGAPVNVTVHLDGAGRVVRIEEEKEGALLDVTMTYGPRRSIALPEVKAPARVNATTSFGNGTYAWNVTEAFDARNLSGFEVRVRDIGPNGTPLARFPLRAGHAEQAGWALDVRDDGDGRLGVGDGFTLRNATWEHPWQFRVEVWDLDAGQPLGADLVPGFEAPLAVLVLMGVAWGRASCRR